jgi:REP element-mobilizing transposase RayT
MIYAMPTPPRGKNLRAGRVSEPGRAYLITTVTLDRAPLFNDFDLARAAINELRACDEAGLSATLAFVLMPDHLHWLVQLRQAALADLMKRFKSLSATKINRMRGTPGNTVWQKGFHDHAIRDGEDIREIARYIVANPIRAGLVASPRDYPHWDALWL